MKNKPGKIVTFYSYKGGVGRSMALANVAYVLAKGRGLRVLVVDWDLEAPGLINYLMDNPHPIERGLIDLFYEYKRLMKGPSINIDSDLPPLSDYIINSIVSVDKGQIDFLPAGASSSTHYASQVNDFDWHDFYATWAGHEYIRKVRESLRDLADIILIDSRTGITDIGGISTIELPDLVVAMFSYNLQNINGIKMAADNIKAQTPTYRPGGTHSTILLVPSRVDKFLGPEDPKIKMIDTAVLTLADHLAQDQTESRKMLQERSIPYVSYYAFAERPLSIERDAHESPAKEYFALTDLILTELHVKEPLTRIPDIVSEKTTQSSLLFTETVAKSSLSAKLYKLPRLTRYLIGCVVLMAVLLLGFVAAKLLPFDTHVAGDSRTYEIAPLNLPETLLRQSVSSLAIQNKLLGSINNILSPSSGMRETAKFIIATENGLKGANTISGDIVVHDSILILSTRINNRPAAEIRGTINTIDSLCFLGAVEIIRITQPLALASYFWTNDRIDSALSVVSTANDSSAVRFKLWGDILLSKLNSTHIDKFGQYDNLLKKYELAYMLDSNGYRELLLPIGVLQFRAGMYNKALISFSKAIDRQVLPVEARNSRALTYFRMNEPSLAKEDISEVISQCKDCRPGHITLKILSSTTDAVNSSKQSLKSGSEFLAAGDIRNAITAFNKAILTDPSSFEAYLNRSLCFYDQLKYDDALADIDTAISLKFAVEFGPKLDAISDAHELSSSFYVYFYYQGLYYQGKKEYDKAIQSFTKSLSLKNDYWNSLKNRGLSYMSSNQYSNAIDDFKTCLNLSRLQKIKSESVGEVHLYLGISMYSNNPPALNEAVLNLRKSLHSMKTHDGLIYWYLANAYDKLDRQDDAVTTFKKFLNATDFDLLRNVSQMKQYANERIRSLSNH